jgi:ABC-type Fe3+-hydroxamate transport system substrate-binding protein
MKRVRSTHWLSFLLCIVLIAAAAWVTTGCSSSGAEEEASAVGAAVAKDGDTLGTGETEFPLIIADQDGTEIRITVRTDKTVVGEALQELGLLEGEEGQYGLYVKVVNGIRADYDKDKVYWAFYINGDYAMSGVDVTEICAGDEYALRVEKG